MAVKKAPIQGYTVEESIEYGYDAYVRISKDKDDDTTSLDTQVQEIRQYCKEHNIPLGRVFEEDFTGTLLYERRVLMHVRNRYLTGKSAGIVFWRYDRLTREPAHFHILEEEMKRHNVKYECVLQHFENNALGRLNRDIVLNLAAYERESILLRTRLGRLARAEIKGKYLGGGKARYGFNFEDKDRAKLVVNKKESDIVVDIYTMRADRMSYHGIARALNDRGIPSPNGKKWENTTVKRLLENGKYLYRGIGVAFATKNTREYRNGKMVHVRRKTLEEDLVFLPDGTVPRIITDELYQEAMAVEEAVQQDSAKANKNPETSLLRCGFIRCGVCKGSMIIHNKKYGEKTYSTYVCANKNSNNGRCKSESAVTIHTNVIDEVIWSYMLDIAKDADIVCKAVKDVLEKNNTERTLEKSTALSSQECDRKLENLWKDYDAEDDDEFRAIIRNRIKEQNSIKKKIKEELEKIRSNKIDQEELDAKINEFVKWCERVRVGGDEEVEYKDKRDRLRFLGIQVFVYPEKDKDHDRYVTTIGPKDIMQVLSIKEPISRSGL